MGALVVLVREDSTDYLEFQLLSNANAINLSTVLRVQLVVRNKDGEVVTYSTDDSSPQLYIIDATNGKVQFRPKAGNLVQWKSPYRCYFWVVSSATVQGAVPEEEEFVIKVTKKFA